MSAIYTFKSVGITEIADLTDLFESRGGPHYCWCALWREQKGKKLTDKASKKSCLLDAIQDGVQVGILAYEGEQPIAWCSVGLRETFRPLGGDQSLTDVWSIVCFFIKRSHRKKGLSRALLDHAIELAKEHEAKYMEAYAAAANTSSYRFMGYVPMYEKAGFTFVQMAGKRRHVMLKEL